MTEPNVHPNITFRITGYRTIKFPDRLSNGQPGHFQHNHDIFSECDVERLKQSHPVGSEHAHLPPPPCRYEMVFTGPRDMIEERRQQFCRECGRHTGQVIDNRKRGIA